MAVMVVGVHVGLNTSHMNLSTALWFSLGLQGIHTVGVWRGTASPSIIGLVAIDCVASALMGTGDTGAGRGSCQGCRCGDEYV